jgi:hypothetical protein
MRRTGLVALVVIIVALAVLAGRVLRPSLEDGRDQQARGAGTPTTVTAGAPTSVATAPTVPPTIPPRPTAVSTATPASRDVVMEVSESELQSRLSSMLVGKPLGTTPLGEATIRTVTVALRDRKVQVGGQAQAGFLNAPFAASGSVQPDSNGKPKVRVDDASVGGVGLPDGTRAALADLLQTEVDGMFTDQSMKVRTIEIADGKMRVVSTSGS